MDDAQNSFKEGVALYEKGDYRQALTAFDKSIALDPTIAEVWNNRGLSFIQTEQYQEALRSIDKALSINPNYENAKKARKIVLDLIEDPQNVDTVPGPAGSPRPQAPVAPAQKRSKLFTVAVIVIMVIVAGGLIVIKNVQNPAGILLPATPTPEPTAVPTTVPTAVVTATAVPTPTPPLVPSTGVWVEIIYDQYYSGTVGTPGNQQMVSGSQQRVPNTGDQFYQISRNDGYVTASLHKNDGSGDKMTVNIYKDGILVKTDSTTLPNGDLYVQAVLATPVSPPLTASNSTGNVTVPASSDAKT
jgi:hypothetical protein